MRPFHQVAIDVGGSQGDGGSHLVHIKRELDDQGVELHTFEERGGNVHSEMLDDRVGDMSSPIWLRRSDSNLSITSSPSITSASPNGSFRNSSSMSRKQNAPAQEQKITHTQ